MVIEPLEYPPIPPTSSLSNEDSGVGLEKHMFASPKNVKKASFEKLNSGIYSDLV